jgi:hypothetical protein
MRRLRYVLLAVLVLAAVGVVVVAVLGTHRHASTARSLARGQVLAASANIFPQSFLFGDPVHIRIDAVVDHRVLDPRRIHLEASWTPYHTLAPIERTTTNVGSYTRLRWTADLHCIVVDCVPQPGSISPKTFEPSTIRYSGRARDGSRPAPVTVTWPQLRAVSRLDPIDLERRAIVSRVGPTGQIRAVLPPWRVDAATLAAPSYRFSPTTVFWSALAVALALVLAAAVLLRPYLPELGWLHRRRPARSRLERALEAVERARGGDSTEERKALELLAAELRRSGRGGLAWTATELAWSPLLPEPERTVALTERVRRELNGRANGHRA